MSRITSNRFHSGLPWPVLLPVPTAYWEANYGASAADAEACCNDGFQIGGDLPWAAKCLWRVREWQSDVNVTIVGDETHTCVGSIVLPLHPALGSGFNEVSVFNQLGFYGNPEVESGFACQMSLGRKYLDGFWGEEFDGVALKTGALFPFFGFTLYAIGSTDYGFSTVRFSSYASEAQGDISSGGISLTLDGQTSTVETFSERPYTVSGSVVITPHKFWTYDGMYDEDTGELV